MFVSEVLTVCFTFASADYRVGRAAPSARRPFFGEIRVSRHAKGNVHNANSGSSVGRLHVRELVVEQEQRPVAEQEHSRPDRE